MSELNVLLPTRSLRVRSREVSLVDMEEALVRLTQIVEERRVADAELIEAENKRNERLDLICKQIASDGIDTDDLIAALTGASKPAKQPRAPRPAKFIWEENGIEKTWTGQGRTPSFLVAAQEAGNLDDYKL